MASLNYNSLLLDMANGAVVLGSDSFKGMLVTSTYTPDKDAHSKRSSVTNEVSGTGYTAGGAAVTLGVSQDNANDRLVITVSDPSWSSATITARAMVIYKSRGGAATADELVAYLDFGADVISSNGTFSVTVSDFYINNP